MGLNPISHYNPIIAPLIKILDPPLEEMIDICGGTKISLSAYYFVGHPSSRH
jgi:hypothetical protein